MRFAEAATPAGLAAPGLHLPICRGARRGRSDWASGARGAAPSLKAARGGAGGRGCAVGARLSGREAGPDRRPALRAFRLPRAERRGRSLAGPRAPALGPEGLGRPGSSRRFAVGW